MTLSADQMRNIAVHSYFGSVEKGDDPTVAALFSEDAVMRIISAGIAYEGKAAIIEHFDDFLEVYDQVTVADFITTADEAAQRIAVQFTITLVSGSERIVMTNCNFFQFNEAGLMSDVAIYMSDLPQEGF